jgi:hypothetical protein
LKPSTRKRQTRCFATGTLSLPRLREYWLDAKDNASKGSDKMHYIYKKAYDSMLKFPLTLPTGRSAKTVQGVGDTIAARLEKRLNDYIVPVV